MTREEAIKELLNMKRINYTLAPDECFDMAIMALERENTLLDRVLEIIDEEIKASKNDSDNRKLIRVRLYNVQGAVMDLKGGDKG